MVPVTPATAGNGVDVGCTCVIKVLDALAVAVGIGVGVGDGDIVGDPVGAALDTGGAGIGCGPPPPPPPPHAATSEATRIEKAIERNDRRMKRLRKNKRLRGRPVASPVQ